MDNSKYMLFSGTTKMAEVIMRNYRLLTLLPRFEVQLGFGDKTVAEVCQKHHVNQHFFLLVCNIHTFDDYFPDSNELAGIDIGSMLNYLKKSHDYYINTRIESIEQKLSAMALCNSEQHLKIIGKFFLEYKLEVLNHFEYEDGEVFPNIVALTQGQKVDFRIDQYEENHDNIDDKLSDLKSIIIKYLPSQDCSTEQRNDILIDIFLFEEDLTKHTRIEEKILIPFVREIERGHEAN